MDTHTKSKLLQINQVFYDNFSESFSATRHQVQPGVGRISQMIPKDASVLDVGCGNGTLARRLAAQGFSGTYLGVDLSEGLLADARRLIATPPAGTYAFLGVDLADPNWPASLRHQPFEWLVAFAVLHHLPGEDLRQQTALAFRELISPEGLAVVSVWQWHNSPKLRQRVLSWSTVGLDPNELDVGDVLLDWRAGQAPGLRYVHTFSEASLTALAEQAGFYVRDSFYSDGKSGNLALYQVWGVEQALKKPAG
jgi:2-polyprenyl-3-methyl-5-hydroxy-6-metoxy-1,4-benzoquinol methylase